MPGLRREDKLDACGGCRLPVGRDRPKEIQDARSSARGRAGSLSYIPSQASSGLAGSLT
jgi:hypothetical protein